MANLQGQFATDVFTGVCVLSVCCTFTDGPHLPSATGFPLLQSRYKLPLASTSLLKGES